MYRPTPEAADDLKFEPAVIDEWSAQCHDRSDY